MSAHRDGVSHWDDVYAVGDASRSWFQTCPLMSLKMLDAAGVTASDSLIDVGGGASRLAGALLGRGFRDITVLDISVTGMRYAQDRLGEQAQQVQWLAGPPSVRLPVTGALVAQRACCSSGGGCRFRIPERGSDSHMVPVGVGQPGLAHPPRAILDDRPGRDDSGDILDVQIHMGDRATVEAVLGQVQLRRAAPQPHIQWPVCPEGVLRFDFEPEPGVPLNACPRVGYVQDRGHALHRSPAILGLCTVPG
jgi:hypothetical protein